MRQRIDTLNEWFELQQRDNKQGVPSKIYYKATKQQSHTITPLTTRKTYFNLSKMG